MTPAQARALARIEAELARLIRYDDESVVHETWIRQRYDLGVAASYAPARSAAVRTAWHEAGHAVAALAAGARFSSASIRHGSGTQGRVHGIQGSGDLGFVIDAAGQIAERLRDWSMPASDDELRAKMVEMSGGRRTVPEIFINGKIIGGFDELRALDNEGKLDGLLSEPASA